MLPLASLCACIGAVLPIDGFVGDASLEPDSQAQSDAAVGEDSGDLDASVQDSQAMDSSPTDSSFPNPVDSGPPKLIAFVTPQGYIWNDISSTGSADARCNLEAKGRLSGRFVAWLPSGSKPAPKRLTRTDGTQVTGPWYRVDGLRIVPSLSALVNTQNVLLENAINLTATKTSYSGGIWTGTRPDGGVGNVCPSKPATTGISADKTTEWTDQKAFTENCSASLALYCLQVE